MLVPKPSGVSLEELDLRVISVLYICAYLYLYVHTHTHTHIPHSHIHIHTDKERGRSSKIERQAHDIRIQN